jgi:hypothetical protein
MTYAIVNFMPPVRDYELGLRTATIAVYTITTTFRDALKQDSDLKVIEQMISRIVDELSFWMRASDCQCQVATVMGSIATSFDTVTFTGRQMKQC